MWYYNLVSKQEKLVQRILNYPKDLRFEELEKVIFACGYLLDHNTGSHAIYVRENYPTLTIPRKTPVKSYLIQQVILAIGDCLEEKLAK